MVDENALQELRSEAVEDFLKTIYILQRDYALVPTSLIAQQLDITPPSATDMAKKLSDQQRLEEPLIIYERYKGVRLTALGESIALEVLRHHRLIELYLVKALGYTWDEVHDEADKLEHHISERFEARIAEYLGHPEIDPHGDPIPTLEGDMPSDTHLIGLDEMPLHQRGTVARLLDQSPEKLQYLANKGLVPGVDILVTEREPYDGLTHVVVDTKTHILSQSITRTVLVSLLSERT